MSKYVADCFNSSIKSSVFPNELKWADITPIHKKDDKTDLDQTIGQLVFYLLYPKYMKNLFLTNSALFLKKSCPSFFVDLERNTVHNML